MYVNRLHFRTTGNSDHSKLEYFQALPVRIYFRYLYICDLGDTIILSGRYLGFCVDLYPMRRAHKLRRISKRGGPTISNASRVIGLLPRLIWVSHSLDDLMEFLPELSF